MKRTRRVYRRTRDERILKYLFFTGLILQIAVLLIFLKVQKPGKELLLEKARRTLIENVHEQFLHAGLVTRTATAKMDDEHGIILAYNYPIEKTHSELSQATAMILKKNHLSLLKSISNSRDKRLFIDIGYRDEKIGRILFVPEGRHAIGKVALIIDDFGYFYNNVVKGFMELPFPLTCSVIPGHQYSQKIAREMVQANKEVFLHMPMEPEEYKGQEEKYIILANMPAEAIRSRLNRALDEIPEAVGVNNHQGSKATASRRVMREVITVLKKRGKYFVDSMTSARSVGYETAREAELPAGLRSVFLDNINDEREIEKELNRLLDIAEKKGYAIGIAHVRPHTLKALKNLWKSVEEKGFEWVFVSNLLNLQGGFPPKIASSKREDPIGRVYGRD